MAKSKKITVDRRGFLKGAAASAAGTVVTSAVGTVATGTGAVAQEQIAQRNATAQPNSTTLAADTGIRPVVSSRIIEKPGSDFMVDVLKTRLRRRLERGRRSEQRGLRTVGNGARRFRA